MAAFSIIVKEEIGNCLEKCVFVVVNSTSLYSIGVYTITSVKTTTGQLTHLSKLTKEILLNKVIYF